MTDWMALAADFMDAKKRDAVPADRDGHENSGLSDVPTKLTKPLPFKGVEPMEGADAFEFNGTEVPTKLTRPTFRGVVSVLSVVKERDEFDDRVVCTNCNNFRYGHCDQHIRAGIGNSSQVAINLVSLPQRCPAFEPKR